ncbi:hypothetical protein ACIBEK_04730 [Nocardia fusca]|uniref:Nucleotide exchange factor GrpE n=1 Tax=Nocardia fusca TaxID=941183 RepID=A0ABV3F2U3_9NOCA|nr:hypothetical protein [Nocardia fusca]
MTEAKRTEKNDNDEPEGGRPGPTDRGRDGGMATREIAPEVTVADETQEPPD